MSIQQFKDAVAGPLKQSIEAHKSPTLLQFRSRDDLTKQWDRAEGMEMALRHIEQTYEAAMNANNAEVAQNVEIIPPAN